MQQQRSVTVFGGSGFIGRYVVARLAARGRTVRVAVRRPKRAEFLKPLGNVAQIVPLRCNLRSEAEVRRAVEGADAVVNLVGILQSHGGQSFEEVQYGGAKRVAEAAAAAGVERLVQISAIGADPQAASDYARSKGAAEQAVLAAVPTATILRPSIVFGPEDGFFNRFAVMARLSPFLPLIGGGKTRFQPVYVGDVADAVMRALTDPACAGRTYELGGPRVYSFAELMRLLLRTIGRRRLLLPLPWTVAEVMGSVFQLVPNAPLTRDQVEQLRHDNVVAEGAPGLAELGIEPHTVEVIVPTYLERFRPAGHFRGPSPGSQG